MPFPSRRPQATLDRVLFVALAAVVLLAAFAGHDAPAVTKADAAAILPVQAPAPVPVDGPAGPVINLPAGSAEIHATAAPAPIVTPPAAPKKWLPSGKGMWIYLPDKTEGGNVPAIIAKAEATGLTHLWVRMGSAWDGFNVVPFVNQLLPAAHAAGIRVIGWDFPKLEPVEADVQRALTMIGHTAPGGHRIDAFSADIETTRLERFCARKAATASAWAPVTACSACARMPGRASRCCRCTASLSAWRNTLRSAGLYGR